jgi:Rrf2 family protein
MKSSRFIDAVHLLALLALKGDEFATSYELARSLNTNPVVVRRILRRLTGDGLVSPQQGAAGGFALTWVAEAVDLAEIYEAVESGPLFALPAREPNPDCPVGSRIRPALKQALKVAELTLHDKLAETTLADVLRRLSAEAS